MGTENQNPMSFEAAIDLRLYRFCAVVKTTGEKVTLPTAGGPVIGINYTKADVGQPCEVHGLGSGRTQAKYGGDVTSGDKLKVDALGRFLLASGADVAAGAAVAVACEDGALNTIGSVVLFGTAGTTALTTESETTDPTAGNYDLSRYARDSRIVLATANRTGALADGLFVGQRHRIRAVSQSAAFTYILTPTTMAAGQPTAFTFTHPGQEIELTWTAAGYEVTGVKTAGVAAVATGGTINPLIAINTLALAGAGEDRILPNGWTPDHTISFVVSGDTGGDTTVSGLFYTTAGAATGVDLQIADAGDIATVRWNGARWFGHQLVSVTVA
jgi:hypothetical protein